MSTQRQNRQNILFLAQFGILLALEAIVCFTPLGSLPAIGPVVATLMTVPVIITALLLGPGPGTLMGFFSGLFSFLVWTFTPPMPIVAFAFTPFYSYAGVSGNFWSLVICFVPRTLVGTVAGLWYKGASRALGGDKRFLTYGVAGLLGSLTNTFGVLFGIFFFFGPRYAEAIEMDAANLLMGFVGLSIVTNGIPEAVLGLLVAALVCPAVKKALAKSRRPL